MPFNLFENNVERIRVGIKFFMRIDDTTHLVLKNYSSSTFDLL